MAIALWISLFWDTYAIRQSTARTRLTQDHTGLLSKGAAWPFNSPV